MKMELLLQLFWCIFFTSQNVVQIKSSRRQKKLSSIYFPVFNWMSEYVLPIQRIWTTRTLSKHAFRWKKTLDILKSGLCAYVCKWLMYMHIFVDTFADRDTYMHTYRYLHTVLHANGCHAHKGERYWSWIYMYVNLSIIWAHEVFFKFIKWFLSPFWFLCSGPNCFNHKDLLKLFLQ